MVFKCWAFLELFLSFFFAFSRIIVIYSFFYVLGLFFELALAAADWLRVHLWELKGHAISFKLLPTALLGTELNCVTLHVVLYGTAYYTALYYTAVCSPLLNALESSLVQCNWLQLWMGGQWRSAGAALANQPLPFINFRQLVLSSHFHALQLFNYQDSNGRSANN